jgi:Putative MetA-pathway of phenol degradation
MDRIRPLLPLLVLAAFLALAGAWARAQEGEQKNISDNSFLIEEAYNQEPGVVQHIFNWVPTWSHGGDVEEFQFLYTMELPLGSQDHQLSFTPLNFEHFHDGSVAPAEEEGGWGDTLINYRYQLTMDDECGLMPAIAPRISVILPTGDEDRGLGTGEVGYQFNLPISKELDRFAFHFNAGHTYSPDVSVPLFNNLDSAGRDLRGYNLGGSAIWLASYDVNFLLELVTLWDEELDDLGQRDKTTSVILNPGVRGALFTGEEVQWIAGVGLPIGLSDDAPDIGVFIYMSVEHNFRTLE